MKRYPTTLIIAGSDSCGGAGIQADIKTCSAIGVYAATAITAITAQNTMRVRDIEAASPQIVSSQIEAVLEDLTVDSIKIGMLCNADIAMSVADTLRAVNIPIIIDPVMVSTSGSRLLNTDAIDIIVNHLFPLAEIITPNTHEASLLSGIEITNSNDVIQAGNILLQRGCKAVLMKGGHLSGTEATDILFTGEKSYRYTAPFIDTHNTHGTGCTLSSAIAAYRALGYTLPQAVKLAKDYLTQAITVGADTFAGKGFGALNHSVTPQPLKIINL